MNTEKVREQFAIDCQNCCGLCCIALFCTKADGFPEDKQAGIPCINLNTSFQCCIHKELKQQKMKGCLAFDCMGAGQYVSQLYTTSWRNDNKNSEEMFHHFITIMKIRQTLWYLLEAYDIAQNIKHKAEIKDKIIAYYKNFENGNKILDDIDIEVWQEKSNRILKEISMEILCIENKKLMKKKNFMGLNMESQNLCGMDFSMAYLMASNLQNSNLFHANFLGADLRDTDIRGADLANSLFLTQMQINSCIGNDATQLPKYLIHPQHWES